MEAKLNAADTRKSSGDASKPIAYLQEQTSGLRIVEPR